MTVMLVNKVAMSAIQSSKNDDIDEAIMILEDETQRRIQDIQQRIEFVCASLRAQGNTEINKMLMSVRQLTVEQFCETYEANTRKFLQRQAQELRANNTVLKRTRSLSLDVEEDNSRKKPKVVEINGTSLSTKEQSEKLQDNEKAPQLDVVAPQDDADLFRPSNAIPEPKNQKPPLNEEPVIISIKPQSQPNLDIKLQTHGEKQQFSIEFNMERLNQLNKQQKNFIKSQIDDLQEKLEALKKGLE